MRPWPRRRGWRSSPLLLNLLSVLPLLSAGLALEMARAAPPTAAVDYDREIRPILAKNCFACHGQDETHRAKGLRLDRRDSAVAELSDGAIAIVPGDPEGSDLIARVTEVERGGGFRVYEARDV